jgi:hypothetical protein
VRKSDNGGVRVVHLKDTPFEPRYLAEVLEDISDHEIKVRWLDNGKIEVCDRGQFDE